MIATSLLNLAEPTKACPAGQFGQTLRGQRGKLGGQGTLKAAAQG